MVDTMPKQILDKLTDGVAVGDGTNNLSFNANGEVQVNFLDNISTQSTDYAGAETNTVFLTPSAGKELEVHGCSISTDSKVVDVIVKFTTSGNIICKLYTSNAQQQVHTNLHMHGAADETIDVTCGAGTFISMNYHEA